MHLQDYSPTRKEQLRDLQQARESVYIEVWRRDLGRCVSCGSKGVDIHEIEQKSHHAKSKQLEAGTFSLQNCCVVCRRCHDLLGQTRFGEVYFKFILHERYGYDRPEVGNEIAFTKRMFMVRMHLDALSALPSLDWWHNESGG
jgi:hypothetical protein